MFAQTPPKKKVYLSNKKRFAILPVLYTIKIIVGQLDSYDDPYRERRRDWPDEARQPLKMVFPHQKGANSCKTI